MIKILKYTEYIYLVIAIISIYELTQFWNVDRQRSYLFIFFAAVSLGMFFFRRRYRKRFEKRREEENS
ncbi:hypothetical protein [Robiginitalea sp. SC105]|uniref:hypothetical protein n=1 Tax=Robiginitalea sp. SC105 TaxID=2762332 RepID=UPI00163998CF|nr:hypothetical protein [Robiginitalea sp. SC105]MBC2837804.1 hypothetical protein [Robiginitalea sp. SC105]